MLAKSSTKDFMFPQSLQGHNSGMSQKEFCRQQNLQVFQKLINTLLQIKHMLGNKILMQPQKFGNKYV